MRLEEDVRYTDESDLPVVTDEMLMALRPSLRTYTIVILKAGPKFEPPKDYTQGVGRIIWEHGKRNAAMRMAGLMPIVCPVADHSGVCGVSIFDAEPEDVQRAMAADPGVQAGVFTFDVHPTRSFPGSTLP